MTIKEIENYLSKLKNMRYSTGVMHISTPAWMQDLRWCIEAIEFLLNELKKKE